MTNLEAIKAKVPYPLSENSFLVALSDRGLTSGGTHSSSNRQAMDLAEADCLSMIIKSPSSVSEGGFSLSKGDVSMLIRLANSLYKKWGQTSPLTASISDATNRW